MALNILNFQKQIYNIPKLHADLSALSLSGSKFYFVTVKGEAIEIHYSANLVQAEVDEVSAIVNTFVEISVLEEIKNELSKKQLDGFTVYSKIVAKMNADGTLYSSIDQGLTVYPNFLTFRNLLKDGFFEFSLRYLVKTLVPSGAVTQEQIDFSKKLIRDAALSYGSDNQTLDAIETLEDI